MTKRILLPLAFLVLCGFGGSNNNILGGGSGSAHQRVNVLLVIVDDLSYVGDDYYGTDLATPQLDRIAAAGVTFENAHATVPVCYPSRTSILVGLSPQTTGIVTPTGVSGDYDFRADYPLASTYWTLPRAFAIQGYDVFGAGKLFHEPNDDSGGTVWDDYTLPLEGATVLDSTLPNGGVPANGASGIMNSDVPIPLDWGFFEFNDGSPWSTDRTDETPDYERAAYGVTQIEAAESNPRGVFVAVGIYKPHFPQYCPKVFWDGIPDPASLSTDGIDVTDLDDIDTPGFGGTGLDDSIRAAATRDTFDYMDEWRRGYLACVEFADAMLEPMLDAVDASAEPWVVMVLGDHGYANGEKRMWQKNALWDRTTRTTLMMYGEGVPVGESVVDAVSLLDVFQTLTDYAEILPYITTQGESLRRMIDGSSTNTAVISTEEIGSTLFTAYKSSRWNYIVNDADGNTEFYDHSTDPFELTNLDFGGASACDYHDDIKAWLIAEAASPGQTMPTDVGCGSELCVVGTSTVGNCVIGG